MLVGKVFCNLGQGVLGGARKDSPRALGGSILAYRTVRENFTLSPPFRVWYLIAMLREKSRPYKTRFGAEEMGPLRAYTAFRRPLAWFPVPASASS